MITSRENSEFRSIIRLKEKKYRDREGLFLVEGERFFKEIPSNLLVKAYISDEYNSKNDCSGFDRTVISNKLMEEVSDTKSQQGIIGLCRKPIYSLDGILNNGRYIILEEINDPGNLGTIIRTSDALKIDCIFISKGSVDLYNSKVLRSTMGSIFHIPIITEINVLEICNTMKARGIKIYSTYIKSENNISDIDFNSSAVILGNEARGVCQNTLKVADKLFKIPMNGRAESLNLSVASAIVMYEMTRQVSI